MANLKGNRVGADNLVYEELVPYYAWTEDSSSHYLLVDLPGFRKDQLKLHIDNSEHVLVSGERQTSNNRIVHFKEKIKVPGNSNMEKIRAKYEGEVLYVILPKQVKDDEEEKKHLPVTFNIAAEKHNDNGGKQDTETPDGVHEMQGIKESFGGIKTKLEGLKYSWKSQDGLLNNATEMLSKNKGIIVTAVVSFSLGVLLSHKFQSTTGSEETHSYDPPN